ncbi:hypothetical protein [Lentibacillus juripiscarius]|uniref:Heme ABC transporter n=1 Tax=Lentibacillus juripiscarius TaxID=257446 RepID=A0ABW5V5Q2_9BACI
MPETENNIEVWEDLVSIRDLAISLIICSGTSLGGYLLAPGGQEPLIFGLVGAVAGFIVSAILVKPKRKFKYIDEG